MFPSRMQAQSFMSVFLNLGFKLDKYRWGWRKTRKENTRCIFSLLDHTYWLKEPLYTSKIWDDENCSRVNFTNSTCMEYNTKMNFDCIIIMWNNYKSILRANNSNEKKNIYVRYKVRMLPNQLFCNLGNILLNKTFNLQTIVTSLFAVGRIKFFSKMYEL